ncbi:uncharacterized protein LOC127266555 [Andrographis paniculata]|uniref:uncharacterized protein LOC127266555 n=1 Tax=Andrographis paniculata TaxID=175694 RepID=UPI0021E84035|nr:uncharacterized protein LOC127266555 [Andrographis paniculata]
MSEQEMKMFFQEDDNNNNLCTSMYHLADAAPSTSSGKRHSPLSPSSFLEPHCKRPATLPSPPSSAADHQVLGFTKLPLPAHFPAAPPSPLCRTYSEPLRSTEIANSSPAPAPVHPSENPSSSVPAYQMPPLPENSNRIIAHHHRHISRTLSDPNPVSNWQAAVPGGTPARFPARRSPSSGESPNAKRLKRMRERLRDMSQWCSHIVDEEDEECENYSNNNHTPKEKSEEGEMENNNNSIANPAQEAVWVEKDGECLVLHFKCPCGNGYQILLSGRNCYYKLTSF